MLKTSILAAALALTAGIATAQQVVVTTDSSKQEGAAAGGALAGAAAGAVVGGPAGAVVGAIVGGAGGAALTPTETVTTYTVQNPTPSIAFEGDIRVGTVLPETVTVTPVPDSDFAYVYMNDRPVVVNPADRTVVWVQTN